ncbi:MAG: phosphoglucomutase/phosphomannomutase alpha/beta/alpha domain [Bacteriovoracaceae bacterium]|nr:phosphoglucomutase/phosphomannomutase alpha/beta/alpha domain [Bacteriovoracaceae bacterium]
MKRPPKMRLDALLVQKGEFEDLHAAEIALRLGQVREAKSGVVLDKPGMRVPSDLSYILEKPDPFVGRGGLKLDQFLTDSGVDVNGTTVLDIGSSTGGFTDCLLQRGAKKVYAVDVGTHQLHESLRKDPRVFLFEETDVRKFDFSICVPIPSIVVVDVSFISLKLVVPPIKHALPDATLILLFKPQFEVAASVPKKRGVAPKVESDKSLNEMLLFLSELGLNPMMIRESAVKGAKGNQEVFIMTEPSIPSHIFRTYDIRGLADRDLKNASVEKIGCAFGKRLLQAVGRNAKVGVGRDGRLSSPRIYESLCRGLISEGAQIFDLGIISTPMAYFAHYNFDIDALLMVTASHNPKDDNGIKMMISKNTLFGPEITSLGKEADQIGSPADTKVISTSLYKDLRAKYLDYLHSHIRLDRKFKIVADCANGMIGMIARDAFTPYASSLDILYENVDCTFPNHEADPTVPANLVDLQAKVKKTGADIGFAFDGDGDRLGVITRKGRILWGDEILMLLSELVLKSLPGATIIGEVKCSEKLFRMIEDHGGVPLMYKTGHSLIKKKMKEVKAPIAGEMSGHLFFGDRYFGFDDAVYGALRVLEVIDKLELDLDDWISKYPSSFVTPEIRVECEESEKESLVLRVINYFSNIEGAKLNLIDGVRVGFSDHSWALVRASNTQAVLVVRIEAISKVRLLELRDELSKALCRKVDIGCNV